MYTSLLILRLTHFLLDPDAGIERGYVVGLHTSLGRLEPGLSGHPIPWDWDEFAESQAAYASLASHPGRYAASPERGRIDAMPLVRVQNFTVSADGFGSGEGQSLERPFGHANPMELMSWAVNTASFTIGGPGGSRGLDDYFTRDFANNIGAEIMGRNKFGPQRGPWDDHEWQGWWGDVPPFHTPVFVLTHHPRPSFTLDDTTFHFVDASPADALALATEAAGGRDVRIGGGVATVREFLAADLIDTMHVAVAPIELGRGERLWASADELLDRFHCDVVPSPSGVTHHLFWRR